MCDTCGCNITPGNAHIAQEKNNHGDNAVEVLQNLLSANDRQARHNREHLERHGVCCLNLMSSPGSGKTSLLEATIGALAGKLKMAVIEGDLETENDAERIRAKGIPAIQITTGSACHLDAHLVHDALHRLDPAELDLLFIENVGNLVCPAGFDLGQHANITLLSVTEGDDKPAKYPVMFRQSDLVLLSKTDLLPHIEEFSPQRARDHLQQLANRAPVFELSAKNGSGMAEWLEWIERGIEQQRQANRLFRPLASERPPLLSPLGGT
ncbi:MAG: hydrogenase nickel incorporation protein HypB [Pseudomonadota bacterium]